MSKLFSFEDDTADYGYVGIEATPESQLEEDSNDVAELVNEYSNDLSMVTEGFKTASGELKLVTDMKCSLESKKLPSVDYFTSIENYSLTMRHIADNLGVKLRVPSLEDFKNPHGSKASHAIAIEGFYEFIKKIWEKIKDFFATFFKKIALFFKRLVNADLDLKTYEEYVDDMVHSLRKKDATLKDNTKLESKLPALLADEGMNSIDNNYVMSLGLKKINTLSDVSDNLFKNLPILTKKVRDAISEIKKADGVIVRKTLNEVKTSLESSFTDLFKYRFELNELPDLTYDRVVSSFSEELSDKSKEMLLQSYTNPRDKYEVLPKNFNMYLVLSRSSKLILFASSQRNTYTQNTLEPVSNLNNMLMLFDEYKKFSKKTDISKFGSIISKSQKDIDECIDIASKSFKDVLESVSKGVATEADNSLPGEEDPGYNIRNSFQTGSTPFNRFTEIPDLPLYEEPSNGSQSNEPDKPVVNEKLKKEVEDTQRYILNVMYSLQVLLRELSTNLAGTIVETRFELIKYLYNSCRRF